MSLKDQTTLRIVLYEGDGSQPLAAPDRFAAMTALLEKGFAVTRAAAAGTVAFVEDDAEGGLIFQGHGEK